MKLYTQLLFIFVTLKCSKDCSYEITHTAERALENLVTTQDSVRCLRCIIPYLGRIEQDDNNRGKASPFILSTFRTLCKMLSGVPQQPLLDSLPSIMPSIYKALVHKSVDLRKASVFCIVEMLLILGWEKLNPFLDKLNVAQRKLVNIYVERHQNKLVC